MMKLEKGKWYMRHDRYLGLVTLQFSEHVDSIGQCHEDWIEIEPPAIVKTKRRDLSQAKVGNKCSIPNLGVCEIVFIAPLFTIVLNYIDGEPNSTVVLKEWYHRCELIEEP